MNKLDSAMKSFNNRQDKKEGVYSRPSEWPRCSANGCPLMSSHKAGSPLCSFHAGQDPVNWTAMTEAVRDSKPLINKLAQMTHASSSWWNDPNIIAQMRGWHVLPMKDNEPPSWYLTRFTKWVHDEIKNKATEYITG